ncbi:hypothetical protein BGX23_001775 [Mortierella sp. AD031]|nr:hypothetical protein BGX23_001775 [Mortierella sp. AD031]
MAYPIWISTAIDNLALSTNPINDVQTVAQKLNIFLDTFDEAYREVVPQAELEQAEMSIERIYGDCSEVMITLFNAIEREFSLKKADRAKCMQEPLNKALVLINLILKEEKYRRQVAEASDFISRLLALLEKPGSPESKILLLRIIATIGESDRNKIEIAKLEGYKKILRLLITDNPELTQEVVRTVNHLLEFNDDHLDVADLALITPGSTTPIPSPLLTPSSKPISTVMGFSPKSILSRSSVQLTRPQQPHSQHSSLPPRPKSLIMDRHISRGTSPFDSPRRQNSSTSLKTMTSIDRVSQAISEVRGIFVQELGKIFPQLKDQDGLGILGMGNDETGTTNSEKRYIPNEEQIQFTIAYYSQLVGQDGAEFEQEGSPEPKEPSEPPEPPEPPAIATNPNLLQPPPTTRQGSGSGGSTKLEKRSSLKKMMSNPDFRVAKRPALEARRNSEERLYSEVSKATRGAAVELAQEEEYLRKSQPDNVLKEFMRTQGALRSLMTILGDSSSAQQNVNISKKAAKHSISTGTRLATKIDIMETVCKVLFQNSANQLEFRAMDGFSVLLKVFDEIVVPTSPVKPAETESTPVANDMPSVGPSIVESGPRRLSGLMESSFHGSTAATAGGANKRSLLLRSLLAVFFDLALDGSTRDMVQNTDAYHFLFRLLLESKQLDIRQQALYSIQDLISLNALNAVAAWRCGEIDAVIGLLREALSVRPTSNTLRDAQWELGYQLGLDTQHANVKCVTFTGLTYFDNFVVSEDTAALAEAIENGSPVYQYAIAITRLLEYMSVMLIQDNAYILYELSRLLMEIDFPDDSSVMINIVLRSVGRIVADMVARGVPVEEKFASIYQQIVCRMLDSHRRSSQPADGQIDEQEQELKDCVHTEQRLLALHILGLVLKGMGNSVVVFDLLQGFETLTSAILLEKRSCHHGYNPPETATTYAASLANSCLCQDCFRSDIVISDLALWLFRELVLQDCDHSSVVNWVIMMLKSTLSGIEELRRQSEASKFTSKYNQTFLHVQPELQTDQAHALLAYLYTKICATVSLVFRKSGEAKLAFGEACGMQILLSVLSSAQHPDIATAALVAIGDFFAGYEGTKALLGDSFGYDGFLEIVLDSCRPLDKVCCEIVLEVATVGNVMSTKSRPHVESDCSIYCTEIWPFIAGLLDPQMLFHAALPFTSPRKVGERNSFRTPSSPPSYPRTDRPGSSLNGRGTPSRPSSVYLEENIDFSASGVPTIPSPALGSSTASSSVSGNTGTTSNGNNRYSIFGISPWSSAATPHISVSSAHEQTEGSGSIPQLMEPFDPSDAGSSRRGSMHLQRSGNSTTSLFGHEGYISEPSISGTTASPSNPSLHAAKGKGGVANRKRSNSRNLGGFGLNTTNLGFQSVVPSERLAFKQLAGIVFRDADAARMTLRLLGRIVECNNPKLATDYFNLLMLLMEVTPRNKELLGSNNGLRFMLQMLFRRGRQQHGAGMNPPGYPYLPRASDPPYVDLVPAMGAYDISVEDVRLLFDAVYDPLDMFFRLTADSVQSMPTRNSAVRDSLGPLPELPTTFEKASGSRRNSSGRPRSESAGAVTPYTGRRPGGRLQGAGASNFTGIQFNPLFIGEMEQQMMYAIEKISERVDPPAYFNFNGINASLTTNTGVVEKAVAAKGGYTVSVWVKVTAFLEKETGLFCYEEENGTRTIFELYFKSLDQSNRYCLCVRTQHYPSPPEDFVFDRFDFAETGIWHHVVFVHNKTMKLMVDGCVIQSYGTFNQRRQDKEGGMIGVLGRKGRNSMSTFIPGSPALNDGASIMSSGTTHPYETFQQSAPLNSASSVSLATQIQQFQQQQQQPVQHGTCQEPSLGFFCGQAGKVHFLQGEWDQATAEKVYNLGPASTDSWKSHDIRTSVIAVLDPEEFKSGMEGFLVSGESDHTTASTGSATGAQKRNLAHGVIQGGLTIHKTCAMRNLIGQVGGIQLCFRFLEMSPSHLQLVGLRVISNLLYKSPKNIAQFQNELDGYELMYELLSNTASELTIDHFGVLFDIAINGMIKDEHLILSSMPCVQLILRLLPGTVDSVQSYILRTLVDLIVESPENMRLWRASFGMTTLFQLFRTLPAHLRPFLMWTLDSMMDGMSVQELGLLIGFIGHEELDLFEVRRDIIEMLFKRMTTDHGLVDLLGSGLEGVTVMIGLLDSPNEHFRILVLKMIGILLSDNTKSGKAALDKPNIGIGLIRSTLEKYPLSMEVIQVLLGLAQNSYRCDSNFRSQEKGVTTGVRKSADRKSNSSQQPPIVIPPLTPGTPMIPGQSLPSPVNETTPDSVLSSTPTTSEANGSWTTSLDSQSLSKADTSDASRHGRSAPRKRGHTSNATAPSIGTSTLPAEPLTINSANSSPAVPSTAAHASNGGAKVTDELTYASMIRLILELTGSLPHTDLVTHTLTDLKRLMTSENMRILWEAGWVNWVGAFLMDKTKVRVTSAAENLSYNRAIGVLDGMMQKMMIFDLSRKGSITVRNKGTLVSRDEDVGVQLRLTEAALSWFDKNPNLETDAATVICKGLVILFRRVEELSRKFEEKQRQAEKARQEAMESNRVLQAQIRAQEQERERLALEAVSSALNGVLDSFGDSGQSDESDSKSGLLKVDEGDTDAEEVSVERAGDESSGSDAADTSRIRIPAPLSGSISPTCSNTSSLSLPLSTVSGNMTQPGMIQQINSGETYDSLGISASPSGSPCSSQQRQQRHHHRHQTNRRHRHLQQQRPASMTSSSLSSSSTPPALPDPTNTVLFHNHDLTLHGRGGISWPPLGLYEHFANCINNLACYNNSAIRAAMKSSGLFKIRDSLIEKLGKLASAPAAAGSGPYGYPPSSQHNQQNHHHHHHSSPALSSFGFAQGPLLHQSASMSLDSDSINNNYSNNNHYYYTNNTNINNNNNPAYNQPHNNYNALSGTPNGQQRGRKRRSQAHAQTGLDLGAMPPII